MGRQVNPNKISPKKEKGIESFVFKNGKKMKRVASSRESCSSVVRIDLFLAQ